MRDTEEREREAETQAEGEAGSTQKPDMGLDPGTPGSCSGSKAGTKVLSHPGLAFFRGTWVEQGRDRVGSVF